jgi:Tfp pilus assembly protein PilF
MSGKLSRKERAKLQSEQHKAAQLEASESPAPKKKQPIPSRPKLKDSVLVKRLNIILLILAVGVYFNSLQNQYALDDYSLILENEDTKAGGGLGNIFHIFGSSYRNGTLGGDNTLYRPLSKVMFAIEWGISPNNPALNHFMNVALYALTVVLLFRMLRRYLTGQVLVPFIATVLFTVHPLHTEVIANIKGRDDILCFLLFVVTALYVHRYVMQQQTKHLVLAAVAFFFCMMSKESAITFVAVIPLMVYFFIPEGKTERPSRLRWLIEVPYRNVNIMMVGVGVLFLGIRYLVLHGSGVSPVPVVDNYIAGIDGFVGQRVAAIAIAGIYFVKLIAPYELVCDASVAQMPEYGFASWQFLLAIVVYGGGLAFAIMKFRSKHVVSFAVLYFLITFSIVSNVPMLIGTNYAERLLYTPSLGFCLIVAWGLHKFLFTEETSTTDLGEFFRTHTKSLVPVGIIAAVFFTITVMRNPVWYDNLSLYGNDMQISDKSCKMHYFYANHITQQDYLAQFAAGSPERAQIIDTALIEFRTAMNLYPAYGDAIQKLAEMYYDKKMQDTAEYYYRLAIRKAPAMATYRSNYGRLLFDQQRYYEAEYHFTVAVHLNARYPEAYNNLAAVYGTLGGKYANAANVVRDSTESYRQIAMMYYNKSIQNSLNAIASNPNFVPAYRTVSMTYGLIGDIGNQQKYGQMAQQLEAAGY